MSAEAESEVKVQQVGRRERFKRLPIDGQAVKNLVEAGLAWLKTNQQTVNNLNVFPVPDGDTGTNMVLTMQSAFDEISNSPEHHVGKMLHTVAQGALMGARGNSGVILSQLWRGCARALDEQAVLDGPGLVRAFAEARDTAYRGVVRPVEGTMLTVSKDIAAAAERALTRTRDSIEILEDVVAEADRSVKRTPELLPVLKEAGVVDAGGLGLFFILEGMLRFINGQSLEKAITTVQPLAAMSLETTLGTVEPDQDYEVVVDFRPAAPLDLERFYRDLEQMGTSIQVGEGDGIYRVHIHVPTHKRYEPIDYTMSLGTITKVSIENLVDQMQALEERAEGSRLRLAPVEPGQIAVVAVSPGPGISRVFASLGVAAIVSGGQTMNPSTQEILAAFENLPTDKVIILPNNKNIIPAANAAADLTVKRVAVIPTRTIPQGLAAMICMTPDGEYEYILAEMNEAWQEVKTGEITTAVRSVEIDGVEVREGQIIGILDTVRERRLVTAALTLEEACLGLLEKAQAERDELVTLFYGLEVSRRQVDRIADQIRQTYPNLEVEVQEGGQPYYQFIFSIE